MKNLYLFVILLGLAPLGLEAQGPGAFIGGKVGLSRTTEKEVSGSNTVDGPKTTAVNLSPQFGYFIQDNIAIGARVLFTMNRSTIKVGSQDQIGTTNGFGIDLFARYHKELGSGGNTYLFGEFDLGYGSVTGKYKFGSSSTKVDPVRVVGAGLSAGVLFFPTDKLGVEVGLGNLIGITRSTRTYANNPNVKIRRTSFDFLNLNTVGLSLGVFYYFNR